MTKRGLCWQNKDGKGKGNNRPEDDKCDSAKTSLIRKKSRPMLAKAALTKSWVFDKSMKQWFIRFF